VPRRPLCGACRCERCGCLAGLAQNGDCAEVSFARAALDVVSARRRARSARGERFGAALVCAEPPGAGRGLVDGAPDERVPEAEASRHLGGANEIDP
jgi:hypothetical protein